MNAILRALLITLAVATGVAATHHEHTTNVNSQNAPVAVGPFTTEPVAMVVNPANGRVYVLDLKVPSGFITYGYVHILDGFTNQHIRTLTAGTFSKGMAFDGYNNRIYVTNSGDSNISIIDANTDLHVRDAQGFPKTIQLIEDPAAITFSYYSGRFYVGYHDRNRPGPAIAEVFGNTDTVGGRIYDFDREITGLMWPPSSLAASRIFALGGGSPGKVWTIESYNGGPSAVHEVGNSPAGTFGMYRPMAGQNSHGYSYVANSDSNTVSMLNEVGQPVHAITVPAGPVAIAGEEHWHTGGGHVFVACRDANVVVEITHDHVTRTWGGFNGPTAALYNPVNHALYVGDRSRIWKIHL